jgi:glycosyltransferase involved in cell wall biosynthesis
MNILIVSTSDIYGGAAVAAFRLMHALISSGDNVTMIVRDKLSSDKHVVSVGRKQVNKYYFYWERGKIFLHNRFSKKNLFDVSIANTGNSITELPVFKEADVIHLHWINQGMLSIEEVDKILSSDKKVVWTMHDMWAFTGICHHAGTCKNYTQSCGNCPYLVTNSPKDLSYKIFKHKQTVYKNGAISFVACSNWLKELALKSPLTGGHRVFSIPNPINTEQYHPQDKSDVRKLLNLPEDQKIVLFAAVKASDPRKGVDYLLEASRLIAKQSTNIMFLIAGTNGKEFVERLNMPAYALDFVSPDKMVDVYNAADLFVTPSLQENLPNTLMEAMSCGTPCVGFNIGGIPEMISHKKNGYLVNYKDTADLANGILWTLYEADTEMLSANARKKVLQEYSQETIALQYKKIYLQS